jgi:cytoplasmic iron level regulating protein YaaA (DUF328/UPF0246 family)
MQAHGSITTHRFIIPSVFLSGNQLYAVWLPSICNTSALVSTRNKTVFSLLYDYYFFQTQNQTKRPTVYVRFMFLLVIT